MEITDGPNKESLLKAFGERQRIIVMLEGKNQPLIINRLEYEDGSGNSFNFVTKRGATGNYNTQTKQGTFSPPKN